jgi:hypothetical protein
MYLVCQIANGYKGLVVYRVIIGDSCHLTLSQQ